MEIFSRNDIRRGIGVLATLGIIGVIVSLYAYNTPSYPTFSYDGSGINGWWSSGNANLQTVARSAGSSYRGSEPIDTLPVADLTVHHGEKDSQDTPEDECFVAFSYYDYMLKDTNAAYDNYENQKSAQGDLNALETVDGTLSTFEGDREYELRQYDFSIEGQDVLSGYQIGFAELSSGHIRVEGVCKTAEDLALTQPILQAVTLNEN